MIILKKNIRELVYQRTIFFQSFLYKMQTKEKRSNRYYQSLLNLKLMNNESNYILTNAAHEAKYMYVVEI